MHIIILGSAKLFGVKAPLSSIIYTLYDKKLILIHLKEKS